MCMCKGREKESEKKGRCEGDTDSCYSIFSIQLGLTFICVFLSLVLSLVLLHNLTSSSSIPTPTSQSVNRRSRGESEVQMSISVAPASRRENKSARSVANPLSHTQADHPSLDWSKERLLSPTVEEGKKENSLHACLQEQHHHQQWQYLLFSVYLLSPPLLLTTSWCLLLLLLLLLSTVDLLLFSIHPMHTITCVTKKQIRLYTNNHQQKHNNSWFFPSR